MISLTLIIFWIVLHKHLSHLSQFEVSVSLWSELLEVEIDSQICNTSETLFACGRHRVLWSKVCEEILFANSLA